MILDACGNGSVVGVVIGDCLVVVWWLKGAGLVAAVREP